MVKIEFPLSRAINQVEIEQHSDATDIEIQAQDEESQLRRQQSIANAERHAGAAMRQQVFVVMGELRKDARNRRPSH